MRPEAEASGYLRVAYLRLAEERNAAEAIGVHGVAGGVYF
jgi:hypothetical protein